MEKDRLLLNHRFIVSFDFPFLRILWKFPDQCLQEVAASSGPFQNWMWASQFTHSNFETTLRLAPLVVQQHLLQGHYPLRNLFESRDSVQISPIVRKLVQSFQLNWHKSSVCRFDCSQCTICRVLEGPRPPSEVTIVRRRFIQ